MNTSHKDSLLDWLEQIGATECYSVLTQADIDIDLVRDLTNNDLRELGLSMGLRKRLQRGIAELVETNPRAVSGFKAERRQLSFLFCDLVGSTRLARQLDPEDMAELQQNYQLLCQRVADKWAGRMLAQYGDGALLVFGHPIVHENDAERAVRAALELSTQIQELGGKIKLQSRIAIATGRVVIGEIFGGADPNSVAGETPNLAARLQDVAEPNTVVVAPSTQRLVAGIFDMQSTGLHELKGFENPVEAFTVLDELEDPERTITLRGDRQVIGRLAEMTLLMDHWEFAKAGKPQVVTLTGEPGIGKSWLMSGFAERVCAETPEMRYYRNFCAAFKTNTALHPFLSELSRAAGITSRDEPETVRERISELPLIRQMGNDETVKLLSAQLGAEDGEDSLGLSAAQQKVAMFSLLQQMIRVEASQKPVLIELEDAHWADPTTLELLTLIATTPPNLPVMLVVTMRPHFELGWPTLPWITHRSLERLPQREALRIARQADGMGALPEARLHDIVAKADGVPLFVEELTRTVAVMKRSSAGDALSVPETLEDSLMSRLDQLAEAKELVQVGATIGRWFRLSTLVAVTGRTEAELRPLMAQLVNADILEPMPDAPSQTYLFRHALIQDAAYASLLLSERKKMHARIAAVLAEESQDATITEPEILARHYAGAEMPFEAVGKLIEAGQAATSRAAQVEANNHFRAALEQLDLAPDCKEKTKLAATVNALLGQSLLATLGFAAPEVGEAFERARDLSEEVGEYPLLLSSLYGVWVVAASRGEPEKTRQFADEALALFGDSDVPLFALGAHFMDAVTLIYSGDLDRAEPALERTISHYSPELHAHSVQAFGDDLGSFALIYLLWSHSLRGDFTTAMEYGERNRILSESVEDRQVEIRSLGFGMSGMQMVNEVDAALAMADDVIATATEQCYPYWVAVGQQGKGWALCHKDQDGEGLVHIETALAFFEMIGQRTPLGLMHTYYGEAMIACGRKEDARQMLKDAIEDADARLDRLYLTDLKRLHAQCLEDPTEAEAGILAAMAESETLGMNYFALRAALALYDLLKDTNRASEAIAHLRRLRAVVTAPMPVALLTQVDAILDAHPA